MRRRLSFPSHYPTLLTGKFDFSDEEASRSCRGSPCESLRTPYPKPKSTLAQFYNSVKEAALDASLVMRLALTLVLWIGLGFRSYFMFVRLILFAICLIPAYIPVGTFWMYNRNVRTIRYGSESRNFLDIYYPMERRAKTLPVVVGVTGGAWIIGHRAWLATIGKKLADSGGCVFVSIDYRNFPQGNLSDMVKDVQNGLDWVFSNMDVLGGDPSEIILMGQSAGAHILSLILIDKARKTSKKRSHDEHLKTNNRFQSLSQIKRLIGVSGAFDLVKLLPHLHSRGLSSKILSAVMAGDIFGSSPLRAIPLLTRDAVAHLPPISLIHGSEDRTVPFASSVDFAAAVNRKGGDCTLKILHGVSHSGPILEGPLSGVHSVAELIMSHLKHDNSRATPISSTVNELGEFNRNKRFEVAMQTPQHGFIASGLLSVSKFINPF